MNIRTSHRRIMYIFFDLDGTLTDPGLGITKSVAYALKYWNIEVAELERLYPFIGPPLMESFQKFYGFTPAQSEEALYKYREYFGVTGLFENEVYPGIPELLQSLKDKGHILSLATSKPEEYSVRILERFDLLKYFDFVAGATMDEKRVRKDEIIAYALEHFDIKDKNYVIMIGDREHDILGAKANGLKSIGVLYGYGNLEELQSAGADRIAEDVAGLQKLLLNIG